MKREFLSPRDVAAFSLVLLAGCAHGAPPRMSNASAVSTTSVSSSQLSVDPRVPEISEAVRPYAPKEVPSLKYWAGRYPDAAMELGEWIASHRSTARELSNWQRRHPEQMEALVDWSITYPDQSLGAFLFDRSGWNELWTIARGDDSETRRICLKKLRRH